MKSVLTLWLLLAGLLLQSVLWVLPAQRAETAERLAHAVVHELDQGKHRFDGRGHEVDASLTLDEDLPQAGHSHANEGVQLQGLPATVVFALPLPALAGPVVLASLAPPSADPDGLLRPPRSRA